MTRTVPLAVVTLLLATLLAGCGSGSDSSVSDDPGAPGPIRTMEGGGCTGDVTLSGGVTASWSGTATVETSEADVAPPASYQSVKDGTTLTLLSSGHGFDPTVLLSTADGSSYGVPTGAKGVDIADDGSGATIDADATAVGAPADDVHITATISC